MMSSEYLLRERRGALRAILGVGIVLLSAGAAAQEGLPPGPPPAPDLTGRYAPLTCAPNGADCPFVVDDLKLTPVGRKMWEAYEEVIGPKFDCAQATPPSLFADPYRWAIHQLTDRLIFEYEKDDIIRTVWLEGWPHPEPGPYDASWQGHSHGYYDGDELVVVTARYQYDPHGIEDFGGIPSSTLKRVTERYRLEGDRLHLRALTEDPLILEEPIYFEFEYLAGPDPLILPYRCELDQARYPTQYADPTKGTSLADFGGRDPELVPVGVRELERRAREQQNRE
ncbi:MAG TPA: hypothetical protein VLD39_07740 [Gammaproteobacteria bacterium]|nr:hypothetical protein [Gammaproteobacteria bacterium]